MRTPADELRMLEEQALRRRIRPLASAQGIRIERDGRTLVNFSSNDYLGLATHPALANAAKAAIDCFGTGSGASRLVCGSLPPHEELESELANLKGTEAAVVFSSGYSTAVGTLNALLGAGDIVILDKLCHASLVDGARMSGATLRVFPHNRLDRLEHLLLWANRTRGPESRVVVATESIFSMDGDRAPLAELVPLTEAHDALLLLDEAHAFGILGPRGAGLAAELGLAHRVALQMGTLSKAAGSGGGYIAADRDTADLIVNRARSLIYSTAPPPAIAAASTAAVRLIGAPEGDRLRSKLWNNVSQWHSLASARGIAAPPPAAELSAIVPVVLGDESAALAAAQSLEDQGLLIPAIRYPTVARGAARLRITFSAAHSRHHIDTLASTINTANPPTQPD